VEGKTAVKGAEDTFKDPLLFKDEIPGKSDS